MALTIEPLPQALGARVTGLDPAAPIDPALEAELRAAWAEHLVLFFPGLGLTDDQHIRLGSVFGALAATSQAADDYRTKDKRGPNGEILVLDGAKERANAWHTDVTFTAHPPIGSLLSMQECPTRGGDTTWANQIAAYAALSAPVRALIDGLTATHGRPGLTGLTSHPMVSTHPVTGRRALYVNRGWTTRIDGLSHLESEGILQMLFAHSEKPEFAVRWSWTPGDAALWDNRCTMHYAIDDYGDARRVLHRVTIYDTAANAAA
jgi:taurine dioxygenase